MKEHPILFSGPMVRAILEGRKTQTRRVVKPQPTAWPSNESFLVWAKNSSNGDPMTLNHFNNLSPYGQRGDRLWVRETWADVTKAFQTHDCDEPKVIAFRADDAVYETEGMAFLEHRNDSGIVVHKWKPSIFLPRPFSRLSLEITNVRVERLQDISVDDIRAEGKVLPPTELFPDINTDTKLRQQWEWGWDKLNGKRKGCDWNSNPWVWVIEFLRAESERSSEEARSS